MEIYNNLPFEIRLLVDNYSRPDFLNQSYNTKAIFLDLGCKCGGSSFYPRHLALKLNYKNRPVF